ncbi:MAG: heavy metal-binding domain-containing protein [Coriobacteriia bacterium]|nr:heavy metal-binding domain-containing protein [Coriobacteriia bacterium]
MSMTPKRRLPIYTTNDAPVGYHIERTLGLCWGITVRSRDVVANAIAGFRTIVGGEINELSELAENAREQALERLEANAQQMGANCIIGMRFDSTEIMQSTNEIIAYGTAVVVVPISE